MEKENIYAKRIDQVQMSSIRVVMEKVEKLKSQGKSVVLVMSERLLLKLAAMNSAG